MSTTKLDSATLEEALAIAGVGCWVWDGKQQMLQHSANFHALLGTPANDLPETPEGWLSRTHPDEQKQLRAIFDKLVANQAFEPINLSLRLRHGSGLWSWFEVRCRHEANGQALITFNDVTQQKQAEAALRDSQLRYRALYATSPLSFVQWDRQGRIIEWNRRAETLFGWAASEVIGKPIHHLLLPEALHVDFNTCIKALIQGTGDGDFSGPAHAKGGQLRHCNWHNVALRAPNGSLLGILSLILDQTKEDFDQQRLEKSEKTYRTLVETSPDAILLLGLDGKLNTSNQEAQRLFGLDALDDVDSISLSDLLPSTEEGNSAAEFLDNPDEYTGFIVNREFRMRRRNGPAFDAAVAFSTLMDAQGKANGMVFFARDISKRLQAERDLDAHRQNLERLIEERTNDLEVARASLAHIIDGSPVATLVLDANHVITHWNAACESIVGIRAAEMIGSKQQWRAFYLNERPIMADIIIDGDLGQLDTLYKSKFGHSRMVECGIEGEDFFPGLNRWLFFTAAPLLDKTGKVVGAIETLQDVSERKQNEAALLAAKSEAEQAAKTKAEFLANMSHEIRTPMNAVIGLAHLMLNTSLTPKQNDYIERIQGAGQMLLGLINDILDFSKIEAGQMQIESIDFSLDDVLGKVTSIIQARAQEKGLEVQYIVDPDVPPNLVGDPLRLAQILINLLGNAIKFTPHGSISTYFNAQPQNENYIDLEVIVQDTGIGMSAAQLEKLFQAFSQADNSITRKYGGTGLGLTICKRLTELMGGQIHVSSEPDKGSTFSFSLRLGVAKATVATAAGPSLQHALVVDDNPLARAVLARLLEKAGCQTSTADSGEQALGMLVENSAAPFDCVTIDLNMPGMNGLELAENIRRLAIKPTPRLILVTASNTHEIENTGRLGSIDSVIHKPVTAKQIARLLASSDKNRHSNLPAANPLSDTHILLVEDIPTNQLIASEILESLGATVEVADNGRIALDLLAQEDKHFDIVLMDIQMPEMDGFEATHRIRGAGKYPDLPIIAMTAHAFEEEKKRCEEAGMNDFLSKPIDPVLLEQVLLRWKPKHTAPPQKNQPLAPSTVTFSSELPDLPGIDQAEGLRRMMNKPRLYERILRDFYHRFVGEAALIRGLLENSEHENAERRAHSTKGLAGSIGAHELQIAAQTLEQAIRARDSSLGDALACYEASLNIVITGIARGFKLD